MAAPPGTGERVGCDLALQSEDLGHHGRVDDLARGTLHVDRAVLHRDQLVGVAAGEVEVVQHDHDRRTPLAVEVREQVEQLDLVVDVQEGRRLVEEEQVGVLGEGHRDPDALTLSA